MTSNFEIIKDIHNIINPYYEFDYECYKTETFCPKINELHVLIFKNKSKISYSKEKTLLQQLKKYNKNINQITIDNTKYIICKVNV